MDESMLKRLFGANGSGLYPLCDSRFTSVKLLTGATEFIHCAGILSVKRNSEILQWW